MSKRILFFCLILFTFGHLNGQSVRILFDASKAESAGNADWVIDADAHNLGFFNGPAQLNGGTESNPQKIPTPAQSGVSSSTAESYWQGGISAWGIDCAKRGYTVETLPYNGLITYGLSSNLQDLSRYTVFIVCEPNIVFTAAEKTAILQFVQNGGGLFMVSDHDVSDRNNDGWDSPHIWNDLMTNNGTVNNPFGISFDYADFSQTTTNIPSLPADPLLHGPYGNVTKAQWVNGTSMTLSPSANNSVVGVVYKTGSAQGNSNVMVAHATYGAGRVVGFGDSSPCDDGTGDPNDQLYDGWIGDASGNHEKLIMNATVWLASNPQTGILDPENGNPEIYIYPNPIHDFGFFHFPSEDEGKYGLITIFDLTGRRLITSNIICGDEVAFDVTSLRQGIYIYRIVLNGQSITNGKFVKN